MDPERFSPIAWWRRSSRPRRAIVAGSLVAAVAASIVVPAALRSAKDERAITIEEPSETPAPVPSSSESEAFSPTPTPGASEPADLPPPSRAPIVPEGNGASGAHYWGPKISADGRYVAFPSKATNLTPDGDDGVMHVYLRDRTADRTTLVSLGPSGAPLSGASVLGDISGDGQVVGYIEYDAPQIPEPSQDPGPNPVAMYVHDIPSHTVRKIVHVGEPGTIELSYNGRYGAVLFDHEIFRLDTSSGELTRASVSSGGERANAESGSASISDDGRYVAFNSKATNLVPDDTNDMADMFVHDMVTGETTRVSLSADGSQTEPPEYGTANSIGSFGSISGDGNHVVFFSDGSNMAPSKARCGNYGLYVRTIDTGVLDSSLASEEGCPNSLAGSISRGGSLVAFRSFGIKVYLWNRNRGEVDRIASCKADEPGLDEGGAPLALSSSGNAIVWGTQCPLDPSDRNSLVDVYLYDVKTARFERVSLPDRA